MVPTKSSQSLFGCWCGVVRTSTTSPLRSLWRGASREDTDVPLRREHVDLVLEEVHLHPLEKLRGVLELLLPFHQLPQPREALRVLLGDAAAALLVLPVSRDAPLGDAVHLVGADLDFDPLTPGPDDGSVKRLVHVGLREGDVVREATR